IPRRGAAAPGASHRHLIVTGPLLRRPVEIVRARDAERSGGINECFRASVGIDRIAHRDRAARAVIGVGTVLLVLGFAERSEEHTSELQSLISMSLAVFCL